MIAAFVAKLDWIPGHRCSSSARDDSQRVVRRFFAGFAAFSITAFFFGFRRSRTHASNSAAGSGWQKK